jgi:hypothetical protein
VGFGTRVAVAVASGASGHQLATNGRAMHLANLSFGLRVDMARFGPKSMRVDLR